MWDWLANPPEPRVLPLVSDQTRATLRAGLKAGIPFALAAFVLAGSFGVVAEPVIGGAAALAMAVLASGGGVAAATVAAILLNLRYVPMGIALAPSLRGGPLRRAAIGQAMIDASWALASRGGGRFDPVFMVGATLPAYPAWVAGTLVGILVGDAIGDPDALGLDALFPAFFLWLLVQGELRSGRRAIAAALLGGAIGLTLTPVAPVGVAVIAASAAALIGLLPGDDQEGETDHAEIEGDPIG